MPISSIESRSCFFQRLLWKFTNWHPAMFFPTSPTSILSSNPDAAHSNVFSANFLIDARKNSVRSLLWRFCHVLPLLSFLTSSCLVSKYHLPQDFIHWRSFIRTRQLTSMRPRCYPFSYYQVWICLPNSFTILYYRGFYLTIFWLHIMGVWKWLHIP